MTKILLQVLFTLFTTEDILNRNKTGCIVIDGNQAIKMPDKENSI